MDVVVTVASGVATRPEVPCSSVQGAHQRAGYLHQRHKAWRQWQRRPRACGGALKGAVCSDEWAPSLVIGR